MPSSNDFIIENGVLKQYSGPGGNVVIPEGVTEIAGGLESGAFYRCQSLTSVTILEGGTSIGKGAFFCELKTITIPASVTEIHGHAFLFRALDQILAPAGSYAERYAKEHGVKFVAI